MSGDQGAGDVVDRALEAMFATPGPDRPPEELTARLRAAGRGEVTPAVSRASRSRSWREWASLALTVVALTGAGWGVGFHRRLLSEVAGRISTADGRRYAVFSDGRVVGPVSAAGPGRGEVR